MKSDPYKTLLVIITGLLIMGWIFKIPSLPIAAASIGGICILIPKAASLIEWLWFKLALALGWINSRILLSIVFFIFLLPIAWLSRLFVKDALGLKSKSTSIYTDRNHLYQKSDLENIW